MHDPNLCYRCGGPLAGTPILHAVGAVDAAGTRGKLFVCSRACRDAANREALRTTSCTECHGRIVSDLDQRGRRRRYCDRKCQTAADRRRARVWKGAARSSIPSTTEAVTAMRADVARLRGEIDDKVLRDVPAAARRLLARYDRELKHEQDDRALRAARARQQAQYEEGTRQMREAAQAETDALNDWLKNAGAEPVERAMVPAPKFPPVSIPWPTRKSRDEADAEFADRARELADATAEEAAL